MALKTCTRAAGAVGAYAQIEIRLSQDTIITATSANYLAQWIKVTAAADGSYSVQLQANADLTPANTYYTVSEYAGTSSNTYNVSVPSSAGPFDLSTIQVSPPPAASALVALDAQVVHLANPETITGVKVFSALVNHGSGDNLTNFASNAPSPAQLLDIRAGTASTPDVGGGPLVKASRTQALLTSQVAGDGSDIAATIVGGNITVSTGQVQSIGVLGWAYTYSSHTAPGTNADACGVYGVGRSLTGSTRVGIGAFFDGRAEDTGSLASGLQVMVENRTGTDQTALPANGFSKTNAVWIVANGTNQCGVGIELGNPFGVQFDVGLEFSSQVAGGKTGPSATNDIRSDSHATTAIFLNGSYSTAAIAVAAGVGPTLIGGIALQSTAGCLLEVQGPNSSVSPLVSFGNTLYTQTYRVKVRSAVGNSDWFVSGGVNNVLTGTASGDCGIAANVGGKFFHIGGTVSTLAVGNANTLGFFNTTPVAQQNTTGTATGFTAGAGTAVTDQSTFTGGTGATAYRISDIVLALKHYGLLAA